MFEDLSKKKLNIHFFNECDFYVFEIENFLNEKQYNEIKNNFPVIDKNIAKTLNDNFDDLNYQHSKKAWITELDKEVFDKYIDSNLILKEFVQQIKSKEFINLIISKFEKKIIKSRIFDIKNFLKLIIRKNRPHQNKKFFYEKFLYNDIIATVEFAYMFNDTESYPHTDGIKKLLSFLLFFPDDSVSEDNLKELGTTFYNSNEFDLVSHKIKTKEDKDNFKKKFNKVLTFPFKSKNLYGFIKSHKSWHSVEPFNISKNFVRKNININFLLT